MKRVSHLRPFVLFSPQARHSTIQLQQGMQTHLAWKYISNSEPKRMYAMEPNKWATNTPNSQETRTQVTEHMRQVALWLRGCVWATPEAWMVPKNVQHATPKSQMWRFQIMPRNQWENFIFNQRVQLTKGDSVWCGDDRSLNPDTDPAVFTFGWFV